MNLLYALVMTLTVNGETTEYVIDRKLPQAVCEKAIAAPAMRADVRRYKSATIARGFSCMIMRKGERF